MEFSELIVRRYSCRAYKQEPVEEEKLERILEAANMAPTACNLQPFRFIVVNTRGREDKLKQIYPADWFVQAPIVVCACAIPKIAWSRRDGRNYADVDTTIAMDHLILAAADLGLGTCWIAAFDVDAAREILSIPSGVEPIAFTPVGYPADDPRAKRRKSIEEIVCYDRWE